MKSGPLKRRPSRPGLPSVSVLAQGTEVQDLRQPMGTKEPGILFRGSTVYNVYIWYHVYIYIYVCNYIV